MKETELRRLLALGEGPRMELKANIPKIDQIGAIVCGLLNTAGGYLVCGVDAGGQVPGVELSAARLRALEADIHRAMSPNTLVSFELQGLDGKQLLVVEVPAGPDVPYAYANSIFLRDGVASVDAIRDLVLRRQIEPERWERRFSFADPESDLSEPEISHTLANIQVRRGQILKHEGIAAVLEELAVAKYGRITNAGDVLFGRNPELRNPQIRVRAACFASDKADEKFLDQKSFQGPLGQMLEETYAFVLRNTPTQSTFSPDRLRREDSSVYPEQAVREALVNAFAHRDYSRPSGGVVVTIYPRRLEIWNSGGLPDGVTVDTLQKGQLSVLRNPDLAHVLYLRGFMERLGRGSVLILKACLELGLPAPQWTSDTKAGVTLTFFAPQATPQVTPYVTPHVSRLLQIVESQNSREELMAALEISDVKNFRARYLKPALQLGLLEMTQPDKPNSGNQRYRLTELGRGVKNQ